MFKLADEHGVRRLGKRAAAESVEYTGGVNAVAATTIKPVFDGAQGVKL